MAERESLIQARDWKLVELPTSWFPKHGSYVGHRWCWLPMQEKKS